MAHQMLLVRLLDWDQRQDLEASKPDHVQEYDVGPGPLYRLGSSWAFQKQALAFCMMFLALESRQLPRISVCA